MSRFFFPASRAHHAYCMAIDFGMEFERRFGKWDRESLIHVRGAGGYKLYVDSESLPLLKPQEPDVGTDADGWLCIYETTSGWFRVDDSEGVASLPVTIIQRNDKPFFMPDREIDG